MNIREIVKLRKQKRQKDGGIEFDTCIVSTKELDELLNLTDKQNKVIDEIYNAFYEFVDRCPGSGMKLLKENGFDIDKCDKCDIKNNNINCKDCIKQYFIRKAEENDKD